MKRKKRAREAQEKQEKEVRAQEAQEGQEKEVKAQGEREKEEKTGWPFFTAGTTGKIRLKALIGHNISGSFFSMDVSFLATILPQ